MISLILAESELLYRRAIREILSTEDIAVVGEAGDGPKAAQLTAKLQPDIAVLNVFLPVLNGLDVGRYIRRLSPKTGVVLLAFDLDAAYLRDALTAGISGIVSRAGSVTNLLRVVRGVAAGSIYQDPLVGSTAANDDLQNGEADEIGLTLRERQVVQLIAECKTTKEIANLLGISTKTAESHRQRAMSKLDFSEPAQLVRYAIRKTLVDVRIPPPGCRTCEEGLWSNSSNRAVSAL